MKTYRSSCRIALLLLSWIALGIIGCRLTEPNWSEFGQGSNSSWPPTSGEKTSHSYSYEDSLTGEKVFHMYCGTCHNARSLSERPFSNYQNVAAHMRTRVNLTGKEHARLVEFLRGLHDAPLPQVVPEPIPQQK